MEKMKNRPTKTIHARQTPDCIVGSYFFKYGHCSLDEFFSVLEIVISVDIKYLLVSLFKYQVKTVNESLITPGVFQTVINDLLWKKP